MARPKKQQSAVENHICRRIRERRMMLGLTQEQFGTLIGVTYQQAHKYERGITRVSAGRLFEIARALETSIEFFYEGVGRPVAEACPRERMLLDVTRHFRQIRDERHRDAIRRVTRVLAGPP